MYLRVTWEAAYERTDGKSMYDRHRRAPISHKADTFTPIRLLDEIYGSDGSIPFGLNLSLSMPTPTTAPSDVPSDAPSDTPSDVPSDMPSDTPSASPTDTPATNAPTASPTALPSSAISLTESPTTTFFTAVPVNRTRFNNLDQGNGDAQDNNNGLGAGIIATIVVSAFGGLVLLLVMVGIFVARSKRKGDQSDDESSNESSVSSVSERDNPYGVDQL